MRHEPALVGRVAREAATQVVIQSALAHVGQRDVDRLPELQQPRVGIGAPQKFDHGHVWELRRAEQPAMEDVELLAQPLHRGFQGGRVHRCPRPVGLEGPLQPRADRLRVLRDLLPVFTVEPRDLAQHVFERRLSKLGLWREIGAPPIWLALGRQEDGQRPAALFTHHVERGLEHRVEVGTFLPVDLHVDEVLVHQRCRLGILEAFLGHHMAPVARRIADGHEDGLAGVPGFLQGVGSPGHPVDRVVLVLQQIGARRLGEQVHRHASSLRKKTEDQKLCCNRLAFALWCAACTQPHLAVKASPKQKADWTPDENHN